jgi:hypothetical protein
VLVSGSSFQAAVGRTLQLGGQSALLLRLLLSRQAGRLSDKFGLEIGADMRAAREAAEAVGAQLVLGRQNWELPLMSPSHFFVGVCQLSWLTTAKRVLKWADGCNQ